MLSFNVFSQKIAQLGTKIKKKFVNTGGVAVVDGAKNVGFVLVSKALEAVAGV